MILWTTAPGILAMPFEPPSAERVPGSCATCGAPGRCVRLRQVQTEEVRGWAVDILTTARRCGACLAEWENTADPDCRPTANAAYGKHRGWPRSVQLIEWRHRRGLSLTSVDAMFGWPPGRMKRFERGGLPSEEDGERLRAAVR